MKILHVIHSLDPRSGGPSHALRSMINAQVHAGVEVAVLATAVQASLPWEAADVYRQRMLTDAAFHRAEAYLGRAIGRRRPWSTYGFSPDSIRWLRRRFSDARQRPDVVHVHGVFSHVTTAASAIARRHGVPYVIRPAGSLDGDCLNMGRRWVKEAFVKCFLKRDLSAAAWIHATSTREAENLTRLGFADRIRVLPHGVAVPALDPRQSALRFLASFPQLQGRRFALCVGRIAPIKRIPLAVESLSRLSGGPRDLTLAIAGYDAGGMEDVRSAAARLRLEDRVVHLGFLQGELKHGAFAAANLFVLPSAHENFGVAVVEALAHALPAVVTPEVAAHVYVDRSHGGYTVEGTSQGIAAGMRRILEGDGAAMGQRGRVYVTKHLSWPAVVRQLHEWYQV